MAAHHEQQQQLPSAFQWIGWFNWLAESFPPELHPRSRVEVAVARRLQKLRASLSRLLSGWRAARLMHVPAPASKSKGIFNQREALMPPNALLQLQCAKKRMLVTNATAPGPEDRSPLLSSLCASISAHSLGTPLYT